ncbi:MAG: hypothetical protein WDN03_12980 [Rhizomicrobium sp.]
MKSALKCSLAAAALFALSTPVLAEATGPNHNPNISSQDSNRTLTASTSANCAPSTDAAAPAAGAALTASSMAPRAGTTGSDLDAGVSAHGDKCAKSASGMNPAPVAVPPAEH